MRSGSKSPKKSPVDSGPGSKSQLQVPQANNRATFAEV